MEELLLKEVVEIIHRDLQTEDQEMMPYGPGTYGSKRGRPPAKKKKKLTKKQRRNPGKLKKDDPRYIALKKKGLV